MLWSKEMNIFRDLVIGYNEELLNLCKQYGVTFVDTEEVGKNYNNSESNFHISTAGHNALANCILGYSEKEITNKGAEGVIESTLLDYEQSYKKSMELSGYPKERELAIADEHKRETEVFQKVLTRRAKF